LTKIAVIGNRQKPGVFELLEVVRLWGKERGREVLSNLDRLFSTTANSEDEFSPAHAEELRRYFAGSEVALTLGGDGTLLYATNIVAHLSIPVIAVNLGNLGFHTQVEPEDLKAALTAFEEGRFASETRLLLRARTEHVRGGEVIPGADYMGALNDIVVSKSAWGRMVHLRVLVDGCEATDLFADGLLISTPTGSSAYNYAAGGPVLDPSLEAIVLNVICPHHMHFSPVVLSPASEVTVQFHPRKTAEEVQLLVDGQAWCKMSPNEQLKISRSPLYLRLVVFKKDFFLKLRQKLAWGGLF
jgi:NAD+ kinase